MKLEEELRLRLEKARSLFERAVEDRFNGRDDEFRRCRGIQYFKRIILGLRGKEKIMNLDELSKVFIDLNIADTACHANEALIGINKIDLFYRGCRYVRVEETKVDGKTMYRVSAGKSY